MIAKQCRILVVDDEQPSRDLLAENLIKFPYPPMTIFAAGSEQHAVRGLELRAVDYILKLLMTRSPKSNGSSLLLKATALGFLVAVSSTYCAQLQASNAHILTPIDLTTTHGSTGNQGVVALQTHDQQSSDDSWSDNVEFYPASNVSISYQQYAVPVAGENIWQPDPGTSWQWQLTGAIDTGFNVDMYDIDLFDAPQSIIEELHSRNIAVICYFSAGSSENWRSDASAIPTNTMGRTNGWAGEQWLDISQIDALAPVMTARLDLAVAKGCDGVEPDNVDGYANNTGFALSAQNQLDYNIWLANEAHTRGLSIGLKNDLDQIVELEPYFDWALNEQCVQYSECDLLSPFVAAGKAVFGVEYSGSLGSICSTTNSLNFDWLKKPLALGSARQSCR